MVEFTRDMQLLPALPASALLLHNSCRVANPSLPANNAYHVYL
ncbi:MAG TPA: hypothetical protein PLX53_10205 [Tenuifilaceae bacterium]|jgi:hypothetical protein|nr:hypothetical protein [Tenuifilaceae bacterium]HPM90330.1 hypothetical protein [Tenuifilaceae bacterium]